MQPIDAALLSSALLFLIAAGLADVHTLASLARADVQLAVAVVVVAILLFAHPLAGAIAGVGVLVLYFRVNRALLDDGLPLTPDGWLLMQQRDVSPEALERAQTNAVPNVESPDAEVIGIADPNGNGVWGAQALGGIGFKGRDADAKAGADI